MGIYKDYECVELYMKTASPYHTEVACRGCLDRREKMCDLIEVIGNSEIFYCACPFSDKGDGCEMCAYRGIDAFTALADEIVKLQKTVNVYGELIDRLEKKLGGIQ